MKPFCVEWGKGKRPSTVQPNNRWWVIKRFYTSTPFWMCLNNWNIGGEGFPYQRWSKVGVTTKKSKPPLPMCSICHTLARSNPWSTQYRLKLASGRFDLNPGGSSKKYQTMGFSIWMINELGRVHHFATMNSFYYQLHFFTLYTLWDYLESTNEIDHRWRENKNQDVRKLYINFVELFENLRHSF